MANVKLVLNLPLRVSNVILNHVQRRHMPVNVPPTATGKRRFRLPVETDPHKLVNYCCGLNYHKDEPPIKLKPDEEYPDWLWELRVGPKLNSWEMEKGTKEYYLRLAEEGKQRNYLLKMTTPRPKKVVGQHLKDRDEYVHRLRFAALAHLEDDAGLEPNSMEREWFGLPLGDLIRKSDYYLPKSDNKVIYKDKIPIQSKISYTRDEESTFKTRPRNPNPPLPVEMKAIQDSKRRHRHASQ